MLWRSAFARRRNDPDERDREALAGAYRQLRDRAGDLVNEIHAILPQLTVHDLTHADTLWDVASEICGPEYKLNPLEGFVLGASFLLHDAGMALAAYPGNLKELEGSVEWRDAVVSIWKKQGIDDPSDMQRANPDADVRNEAIFQVLRTRHASQARILATAVWTHPATGLPLALVQNDDLLESYGELIGNISASHHWPLPEVARFFGEPTPASAAWPREWKVNSLQLACILRCADACAIDETRAPSFLFAIRKPTGTSKRHWAFQNKIYPAQRREDGLVLESKSPFYGNESEDWWLCFDAIDVADRELRGSDALLTDRHCAPFAVRRMVGAGDPEVLIQSVKVDGWKPVNTQPKISDPQSVIERLGGKQLYGDNPMVPIRELIQNSVDAIRARRFLDPHFRPTKRDEFPGRIRLEFSKSLETDEYWISVEDNGIGMSERTITRSLLDFGNSFWSSPAAAELYPGLPSEKDFRPVGRFGIGFFSIFMYSDVAKVMSREFKSGLDSWNVLSFEHGVRGRGNFSIEKRPTEIRSADASTRIKIKVSEGFLQSLVRIAARHSFMGHFAHNDGDTADVREQVVVSEIKDLVCALDVRVSLSFLNDLTIEANDPFIYKKEPDTVWACANRDDRSESPNQITLLSPMGASPNLFGFCGISIEPSSLCLKSVGGLSSRPHTGEDSPIAGIAEYKVTTANRDPEALAAPNEVLNAWGKVQIEKIRRANLSDRERETAAFNFGEILDDIRPLFYTRTSEGWLNLDEFFAIFKKRKTMITPISHYKSGNQNHYFYSLPHLSSEFRFRMEEIAFAQFTHTPFRDPGFTVRHDSNENVHLHITPGAYRTVWQVIVNTLRDSNIEYSFTFLEDYEIGKYTGLESLRNNLKNGDLIRSDVFKIVIK